MTFPLSAEKRKRKKNCLKKINLTIFQVGMRPIAVKSY